MTTFVIVWLGQLVSTIGSGLTGFALGIWVYQRTGSVTQFALIGLAGMIPRLLLSPLAGAVIDRWGRRRAMILADTGAAVVTLVVAALFYAGNIRVWHLVVTTAVSSAFTTFQWPAYAAATAALVKKEHLGRANGMVHMGRAAADILAPTLSGALLVVIGVEGVLLVDVLTFLVATATLLFVRFPEPAATHASQQEKWPLRHDMAFGFSFVRQRPGLMSLLGLSTATNFLWGMVGAMVAPMVLSFGGPDVLGRVITVAGTGMLLGGLLMSAWGGGRRRVFTMLAFEMLCGVCFIMMGLRPLAWLVAGGAFVAHLTIAVVQGSSQALWQSTVEPEVQGRVFSISGMISQSCAPLAYVLVGPLADNVFEPALAPGGVLAGSLGAVIGTGPGRGIAALFMLQGIIRVVIALAGAVSPRLRHLERT